MLDTLVQHLLEEIAMDGQAGTDITRLSSFITDFYSPTKPSAGSSSASGKASTSQQQQQQQQNTDPAFLSFVWDTLVNQEDVHVGVLSLLAAVPKEEELEEEEEDSQNGDDDEENEEEESSPKLKGKGKAKAKAPKAKRKKKARDVGKDEGTHHFEVLADEKAAWSRDKLMEEFGDTLRIAVGPDTAWTAITGSSMRPNSLTPPVYATLEIVSRGRGDGATTVTIGRDLGIDQKSAFHFIRVAVNLGIVKKFRTIEHGCWTNRILHVRYLSVSPHWAVFLASDEGEAETGDQKGKGGGEESSGDEGEREAATRVRVGAIGRNHLVTNAPLVKARIVRALRGREKQFMPHRQIASAIGLYKYNRTDLRRLNSLITQMSNANVVEKTLVMHQATKNSDPLTVQCLRLVPEADSNEEDREEEAEIEDDDSPHALALIPIERQIHDLLTEAGAEGLTISDLAYDLGSIPVRTIDQILARLTRAQPLPSHLRDLTLHLVTETVGREKRIRWFTLGGYLRRCERDGVQVPPGLGGQEGEGEGEGVGGWMSVGREEVFESVERRWEGWKGIDVKKGGKGKGMLRQRGDPWAGLGKKMAGVSVKKRGAVGRPKGSKNRETVKDEEEGAAASNDEVEEEGAASTPAPASAPKKTKLKTTKSAPTPKLTKEKKPKPPKEKEGPVRPRGRPRKHPEVPGKLNWYQKRKLEDAERAAKGLEPRKKGEKLDGTMAPARKGRKEKEAEKEKEKGKGKASSPVVVVDDDEEVDQLEEEEEEEERSVSKEQSAAVDSPAVAVEMEVDALEAEDDTPAPPPPPPAQSTSFAPPRQRTTRASLNAAPGPLDTLAAAAASVASSVAPEDEVEVIEPTPAPVKRGRGRPRKDGTSKAAAPAKVAPAPTRKRGRAAEEVAPAEDVQIVNGSEAVLSVAKRARQRLEPYVEVFVSPRRPVAPPKPSSSAARAQPAVDAEQAQAGPSSDARPQVESDAAEDAVVDLTSEVDLTSSPGPSATPRLPRARELASQTSWSRDVRYGTPLASKATHSSSVKQNDILLFLQHPSTGGVAELGRKLEPAVRKFLIEHHPTSDGAKYRMDFKVATAAINGLVERGLARTTVVSTPGGRVDVLSLAAIPLDDERITNFISNLTRTHTSRRFKKPDLPTAGDLTLDESVGPKELGLLDEPSAEDTSEVVRGYFKRIPGVLGAQYGVLYGRVARARHLHQWLVNWVATTEVGGDLISKEPIVFTHSTFTASLPLGDYLRIVTVPVDNDEFAEFVADKDNLATPLASLPRRILAILKPTSSQRLKALWPTVDTLEQLGLLNPLVESLSAYGEAVERTYEPPTRAGTSTHWQLNTKAPVYAFAKKTRPLIAVMEVGTSDEVTAFWEKMHEEAFPGNVARAAHLEEEEAEGYALAYPGKTSFAATIMTSTTKWHADYMLLLSQRRYLSKRIGKDKTIAEDEEVIEVISRDTLAPKHAVLRYLGHLTKLDELRQAKKAKKASRRAKKRRKVARDKGEVVEGDEEDEEDDEWEDEPEALFKKPRVPHGATKSKKKRQPIDAAGQRELAFTAIVDRFKAEHGQPDLPTSILNFLQQRFCYSRRGLIDSTQLQLELLLLLPANDDQTTVSDYVSVVPPNVRRSIAVGDNPYSLPARPLFTSKRARPSKRVVGPPKVAAPPVASTSANVDGEDEDLDEDEEVAPQEVPVRPAGAAAALAAEGWWPSVTDNRQNDFLSTPARAPPELKDHGRLPRNYYSAEQDDLLLDAAAILRARCEYTGRRIVWTPMQQLFSDIPAAKIRHHFKRLTNSKQESVYHDRLVEAWGAEWEKKRGSDELPDEYPQDLIRFDLAAFVKCLRATVDKRALRLSGPRANAPPADLPINQLPATLAEFEAKFVVDRRSTEESLRWDGYLKTGLSGAVREETAAAGPFSTLCSHEEMPARDRQLVLAEEALKMMLGNPVDYFDPNKGSAFLAPYVPLLDRATKNLFDRSIIISKNAEFNRRGPGRGHALSERFLSTFEELIGPAKSLVASNREYELLNNPEPFVWPLLALEGDMLALARLAAEGKISMTVDTAPSSMLRDPNDYQTRQKDDEVYELTVHVSPADDVPQDPAPRHAPRIPPVFPREGITDDSLVLAAALSELEAGATDDFVAATEVLKLLRASGSAGMSHSALAVHLPHLEVQALREAQKMLITYKPPLAFWAGDSTVSLVAAEFLSDWTVLVRPRKDEPIKDTRTGTAEGSAVEEQPEADVEEEDSPAETPAAEDDATTRIFPAPWLDIHGGLVPMMWEKAVGWINSLLLSHGGATTQHIYTRSSAVHLLTLTQVLMILESLEGWGLVERRTVASVVGEGDGREGKELGWDEARWYISAGWSA